MMKIQVFHILTPYHPIKYAITGYSKIPLIWLTLDQTDARLPNILDYQIVSILTKVLTGSSFVMASILGLKTNQTCIPLGYLLHLLVQSHQGPLLCWWNRRQGARRHNSWHTDAPGGLFELVPEMCLFNCWSFLPVKTKLAVLELLSSNCQIIRFSESCQINIILL